MRNLLISKFNFFKKPFENTTKSKFIFSSILIFLFYRYFRKKVRDLYFNNDFKEVFEDLIYPNKNRYNKEFYHLLKTHKEVNNDKKIKQSIDQNKEFLQICLNMSLEDKLGKEILKLNYDVSKDITKKRKISN